LAKPLFSLTQKGEINDVRIHSLVCFNYSPIFKPRLLQARSFTKISKLQELAAKVGLNSQTRRRSDNQPCAALGAQVINAPNMNTWSSLTDDEAASVAQWLFSHPTFNLTATADAGAWDNSL